MYQTKEYSLSEFESMFDEISLESVIDAVEALKNNCRDSTKKDPRYASFCGVLKETEAILQRTYKQSN